MRIDKYRRGLLLATDYQVPAGQKSGFSFAEKAIGSTIRTKKVHSMNFTKIEATLDHGAVCGRKDMLILSVMTAAGLLIPLITVVLLIVLPLENANWKAETIIGIVVGNLGALFFSGFCLWVIVSDKKVKKKIALWLKDAVELTAAVHSAESPDEENAPHRVQVNFRFEGKAYSRTSTGGSKMSGRQLILRRYVDKEIRILYSPKYDKVIIPTKDGVQTPNQP